MPTTVSEASARLPSMTSPREDALESLRSPENSEFGDPFPGRDSIVTSLSELDDIALDDDGPLPSSSAPLTSQIAPSDSLSLQEPKPLSQEPSSETTGTDGQVNGGFVNGGETVHEVSFSNKSHQKSASVTTIRSGHNLSFIDEKRRSTRISVDGQQALQEEFSRLQKERQALQEQGAEGIIDWGAFTDFLWCP